MKNINCIIYSKDRACQLHLLLRSIREKFLNAGHIYVLWDWSREEFRLGYMKLFQDTIGLDVTYVFQDTYDQQNTFEKWTRYIIGKMNDYYLGFCDDDVIIKEFDCSDILSRLDEEDVNAISLKAGLNIIGNYPNFVYSHPNFIETEPYLKWEWRKSDSNSDWGYPTCINSYIFKKEYFLNLINDFGFTNPTRLEGGLNTIKNGMKKYMYSFKEQKVLNIPANRIQQISPNPYDEGHDYTPEYLNTKFLNGYMISTENMYDSNSIRGNEERDFILIRGKK